jgi:hypothetical protein
MPIKFSFSDAPDRKYGIDFTRQELIEWSIVGTPANPECLLVDGNSPGETTMHVDPAKAEARLRREAVLARLRAGLPLMPDDSANGEAQRRRNAIERRRREVAIMRAKA